MNKNKNSDEFNRNLALLKIIQSTSCDEDRLEIATRLVSLNAEGFDQESCNILCAAFKDAVMHKRRGFKVIKSIVEQKKIAGKYEKTTKLMEINTVLGKDVIDLCNKIIFQIQTYLLPANTKNNTLLSMFTFLHADLLRYKCECCSTEAERNSFIKEAQYTYKKAMDLCAQMPVMHPHRISLQLNYSTFVFEHLHDRTEAIKIAQKALESSSLISTDKADDYVEIARLQNSLKANINQWSHIEE